jgi:hypothetical protein
MPSPREEHRGPGADDQQVIAVSSENDLLLKAPAEIQIGVETLIT